MRTESTRKQLQQTIAAYEQNLAAATDRLQRAQNAVNGKTEPELSACKAAEQHADALYRQLTAQTAVTAKELSDLQKAQLQLQELEKRWALYRMPIKQRPLWQKPQEAIIPHDLPFPHLFCRLF